MKRRVAFKTLGCRLNQSETDSLYTDFYKAGYEIVDFNDKADAYIINTCTVTSQSDHKSKNFINNACRKHGKPVVVVTGCLVNSNTDYFKQRDDITYFIPNKTKSSIFSLIDSHFKGEVINSDDTAGGLFNFSVAEKSIHTRSFIKINDGCDNSCSYCIVPQVRGSAVSRPPGDILDNIRKVVDFGYKEVVLTGVNISCYKFNNLRFEDLIEEILKIPGDFRVRISSIEPENIREKLAELLRDPKLAPHLHICLQSGSDNILKRMGRVYNMKNYLEITDMFRRIHPDMNFTTDIIVGFPGETENDFLETCKVIKNTGFSHVHTFKYSVRKKTPAAGFSEQIPEKTKNERSKIIRIISDENKLTYRQSLINKTQRVLIEKISVEGQAKGYGEHYVPVRFDCSGCRTNTFKDIMIRNVDISDNMILMGNIL